MILLLLRRLLPPPALLLHLRSFSAPFPLLLGWGPHDKWRPGSSGGRVSRQWRGQTFCHAIIVNMFEIRWIKARCVLLDNSELGILCHRPQFIDPRPGKTLVFPMSILLRPSHLSVAIALVSFVHLHGLPVSRPVYKLSTYLIVMIRDLRD